MKKIPFLIIGSGIAGMSAALRLSVLGKVLLITKSQLVSGSTPLAQGGIAAVTQKNDSQKKHEEDTLKAGHFANNKEAVEILVEYAPQMIADLEHWGVQFSKETHLEGGHSFPRILNTGDNTGLSIAKKLAEQVQKNENIEVWENTFVVDFLNNETGIWYEKNGMLEKMVAENIILASGGAGSVFLHSTTPLHSTGDCIAMAIRAGMEIKNLSVIQFHPTALACKKFPQMLISEAVRGAGATIIDENFEVFVNPLLPRDQVSAAVFQKILEGKEIFLDARHIADFEKKFPNIHKRLKEEFFIFPEKDLIPIVPAVHYFCGGIATNTWGQTSRKNIFATGECAATGVHGKNRLASNSLLEGMVFSARIFEFLEQKKSWHETREEKREEKIPVFCPITTEKDKKNIEMLQEIMEKNCGIVRKKENIPSALAMIRNLKFQSQEGKNMQCVAEKILEDMIG